MIQALIYTFMNRIKSLNSPSTIRRNSGFTLIELLIVIVIITALAVTVFVALNPVKRTMQAREARRTSDVETILTAIHEYIVDNQGSLPTGMSTNMPLTQIGTGASGCSLSSSNVPAGWASGSITCQVGPAACVNLATPLATYLKSIPIDPKGQTSGTSPVTLNSAQTGYAVSVDANNIVTVVACGGEGTTPISQSR